MMNAVLSNFCRQLLIDNFVPPEERDKLETRLQFDEEEEVWSLKPLSETLYESFICSQCTVYIVIINLYISFYKGGCIVLYITSTHACMSTGHT